MVHYVSFYRFRYVGWLGAHLLDQNQENRKESSGFGCSGIQPYFIDYCDFLPMRIAKSCTEFYFSPALSFIFVGPLRWEQDELRRFAARPHVSFISWWLQQLA